jgi:hypothetical protein
VCVCVSTTDACVVWERQEYAAEAFTAWRATHNTSQRMRALDLGWVNSPCGFIDKRERTSIHSERVTTG